jgi:hypothetical protein
VKWQRVQPLASDQFMSGRLSAVGDGVDCAEDDLAKANSPAKNIARRNNLENLINITATSFLG